MCSVVKTLKQEKRAILVLARIRVLEVRLEVGQLRAHPSWCSGSTGATERIQDLHRRLYRLLLATELALSGLHSSLAA